MGQKYSRSTFTLENNTYQDIINTQLSSIDNYDWHGNSRPDHNFAGARIPAGSSKTETEDMNARASGCPFTMTLTFKDGSKDEFRIHQKYAYGKSHKFWFTSSYRQYSHNRNKRTHSVCVTITDNPGEKERNEAKTYFLKGKMFWDDGWSIEKTRGINSDSSNKFEEAIHEFENAKNKDGVEKYGKYYSLALIKIEGNNVVDSAYQQEIRAKVLCAEAATLPSTTERKQEAIKVYLDAMNELRNAKINYTAAEKVFMVGIQMGESLFNASITEIQRKSANIDKKMQSIEDTINRLG